jgi:ABC-2 type transport system permease protein
VIATLFGPIFFSAIIIVPAWISSRSKATSDIYNTAILDASGNGFGHRLAINIAGDSTIPGRMPEVRVLAPSALSQAESTATHEVMQKDKTGYVVVDQQTLAGEAARYAGRNATSIADMERVKSAIKETILASRLEKVGLDNSRMKEITFIPLNFSSERITDKGRAGSGIASVLFGFAIGFLLYASIVIYGQTIMSGVLEEKTTRVAEVVMSSVPTDTLLAGKVLGVGAVGLTQQIIWIVTTYILLQLRAPIMARLGAPTMSFTLPDISLGAGIIFLLFFLFGFIFYSSLFAAVGASVNSESEARQAASPLMIMIISTAVFIQPVLLNPTGTTARVLSLVPFSSPIIMPIRMAVIGIPTLELAASLGFLAIGCVLALWLASRIYRVGLLMYGKRPTIREMARWVTYAR